MLPREGIDSTLHSSQTPPEWVVRMDEWTERGIPYLFILDFDLCQPIILPLTEVQSAGIACNTPLWSIAAEGEKEAKAEAEEKAAEKAEAKDSQLRFSSSSFDHPSSPHPSSPHHLIAPSLNITPVPYETYLNGFEKVRKGIYDGDTYLLNLCYSTHLAGITSLEDIYHIARAPYKLLLPGRFVLFSPEQFVSISDGMIRTFPMKGTIDAAVPNAAEVLMTDLKEKEEHATVVDLLRNDLSIVASQVTVNRYRFITEIKTQGKTLLQCSSEISGILEHTYQHRFGSLMQALLPAGSVTGAPKKRTVEIIRDAEPEPRGYFTGVFGVFDGTRLDSAVMIRMIEQREDGYYYRSGGGITYRSRPEDEYREMIDKVYVPVS